ncbi:MAG TPA: phosphoenolpyruvate carboxylase, partial [Pirellulales bacterium]|nr:phosphoenolpyruvate carboxylase [Pirellulales bacterium]
MVGDDLLRRDVRLLGDLLGNVIREVAGAEALDLVEEIRRVSRDRRSGSPEAEPRLAQRISGLSDDDAELVSRAFSVFFDLTNLAEDRQRVRVLRWREQQRAPRPRNESLGAAIIKLQEAGFTADQVQRELDRLSVELVFTAHPSEAKRRSVRAKIRRMRETIEQLDRHDLLPRERRRL